jgi:hypothetical protein
MPFNYTIDSTLGLVTLVFHGADTAAWKILLSRVYHDPRRQDGSALLCTVCSADPPDAATVLDVIDTLQRFWPLLQPSRAAVLTSADFDSAALNGRAAERDRLMPLRVFNSHDSALRWVTGSTERRNQVDRRKVWRGGRRISDWRNRPSDAGKGPETRPDPASDVSC